MPGILLTIWSMLGSGASSTWSDVKIVLLTSRSCCVAPRVAVTVTNSIGWLAASLFLRHGGRNSGGGKQYCWKREESGLSADMHKIGHGFPLEMPSGHARRTSRGAKKSSGDFGWGPGRLRVIIERERGKRAAYGRLDETGQLRRRREFGDGNRRRDVRRGGERTLLVILLLAMVLAMALHVHVIGFDMSMACDMSMPDGMSIRQITSGDWAKPSGLGIQPMGSNARSIMAASASCTAAKRKARTITGKIPPSFPGVKPP